MLFLASPLWLAVAQGTSSDAVMQPVVVAQGTSSDANLQPAAAADPPLSNSTRNAVVTYASGDHYCLFARTLLHSAKHARHDLVLLTPALEEPAPACKDAIRMGARHVPVPSFPVKAKLHAKSNYLVSFNKMWALNLTEYGKILYADADSFFTPGAHIDTRLFDTHTADGALVMSLEQGEGTCGAQLMARVSPTHGMNAGLWLARPTTALLHAAIKRVETRGCLSDDWHWCDQELLICLGAEKVVPTAIYSTEEATSTPGIRDCGHKSALHVHYVDAKERYYALLHGQATPTRWDEVAFLQLARASAEAAQQSSRVQQQQRQQQQQQQQQQPPQAVAQLSALDPLYDPSWKAPDFRM